MIKFKLASGATVTAPLDNQVIQTQRGAIAASEVKKGDFICHCRYNPKAEVVEDPEIVEA